ncbi:MAG: hypothetical protein AAFY17_06565, partial [Cyanobacteria bacterium J06642_11]
VNNDWVDNIVGSYNSRIWNGVEPVAGKTEFLMTENSTLIGSYVMDDPSGLALGVLTECQPSEPRLLNCTWYDRYGTGDLDVRFSEDFVRFEGTWGSPEFSERFGWQGIQVDGTPQPPSR